MKETRVSFPCGGLLLEGVLTIPEDDGLLPAVIVCHPHPLYGGSMDNSVVCSITETITQASLVSLKFNFRGVGGSQGAVGEGMGEREDVKAAISFVGTVKKVDSRRIGLAGYSAGAGFALPIGSNDTRIKALAAISPPFSMFDFDYLEDCPKSKLLISGSKDDYVPIDQFLEFCGKLPDPKECQIIEGADHFWWGYEASLTSKVAAFFARVL